MIISEYRCQAKWFSQISGSKKVLLLSLVRNHPGIQFILLYIEVLFLSKSINQVQVLNIIIIPLHDYHIINTSTYQILLGNETQVYETA